MERTKLLFDHEDRTIGTLSRQVGEDGEEVEQYLRVLLFNFTVTGYISGPRPAAPNKFVGYRILIKFTEGHDREVVINHSAVGSFQKFCDALRNATFGLTFSVNQFDESLWPDLWARVYFHCTEQKICKNLRPADNLGIQYRYLEEMQEEKGYWCDYDYEEVFSDKVLGADGKVKEDPAHVFVPELMKKVKLETKVFEPTGLEGLLEMMNPPYTHHNPEVRVRQVIALMAAGSLRYYRFIVDQTGGCPTMMFASKDPSTMKTTTALLCQKVFSQQNMFMAPGSTQASIDLAKSMSSNTILLDDLENMKTRHKLIMDGYNGASKTTVERGEEYKLAGQLISFNITETDRLLPKEDEGRTLIHHFPAIKDDQDFDDAFDHQVEHQEAMKSKGAPHDFHAAFGANNFKKEPGERSHWQDAHKEAMRVLRGEGVTYGSRKLASYSQAIAYFLLLEQAVENSSSPRCHQLWVQAVKDRRTFIDHYMAELESTDMEIARMMDQSKCLSGCPSCACAGNRLDGGNIMVQSEVAWEDIETVVEDMVDRAEFEDKAEVKKVLMVHTEKDGSQNLSISHTNSKTSFLKKSWSELGFPKKHVKVKGPRSKTFVKKTSIVKEADGGCKGEHTQAAYCYQINIQEFSEEIKEKILKFFDKEEIVPDETETQATQSQDFREFHQNEVAVLYCKLCQFQGESTADLKKHIGDVHVKCALCKKSFSDERKLQEHMELLHTEETCDQCGENIPKQNMKTHKVSHKQKEGFKKVLENVGKIRKQTDKPEKVDKRVAYKFFIEETKAETREKVNEENPEMTAREKSQLVTKIIADMWKKMTAQEKEDYGKKKLEEDQRKKRGENVMNIREDNTRMPRITKCKDCGRVCLGEQHLMRHQIESHSIQERRGERGQGEEVLDEPEMGEEQREEVVDEFEPELEEREDERVVESEMGRGGRWRRFRKNLIE